MRTDIFRRKDSYRPLSPLPHARLYPSTGPSNASITQSSACAPPEPAGDRPGAAAGVQDHAVAVHVHHGAVRGGSAALLDHQQYPVDRAAAVDVPQIPGAEIGRENV